MGTFDRAPPDSFINILTAEAAGKGWWRDVLDDDKLVIALRGSYLSVYRHGQSLSYVEESTSGLKVTTHIKYLVDPALDNRGAAGRR